MNLILKRVVILRVVNPTRSVRQGHASYRILKSDLGKCIPALSKIQQVSVLNWQLVRYPIYPDTSAVQGYNPSILIWEEELFYSFLSKLAFVLPILIIALCQTMKAFINELIQEVLPIFFIFRNANNHHNKHLAFL